ncbi:MAG TPA: hypothetical protein VHO24_08665 [Opitutaceae bacterium]|nr:hypothetical protein [Opitutaceae bacterium]
MNLTLLLKLAALTHVGLIAAGLLMPVASGLWAETAKLSPFGRRLFKIYYAYIGLCLIGFGLGSWFFAEELASGGPLARGVCGLLTCFWLLRFIAVWLLDVRPYLTNGWWRLGYQTSNGVIGLLPCLYAWATFR